MFLLEVYTRFVTFIVTMTDQRKLIKYKRLKVVRALMYLDALFLVLSVALLDPRDLSFAANSSCYARVVVLLAIFGILYATEKNISRYLRKHRSED